MSARSMKLQRVVVERVEIPLQFGVVVAETTGEAERGADGRLSRVRVRVFGQAAQWVPVDIVTKNLRPWYPESVL
jgi:hypothetical protein